MPGPILETTLTAWPAGNAPVPATEPSRTLHEGAPMRVEMIQHITGTRNGVEWPLKGGTIELPNHEAADLIGAGLAKEATDEAVEAEAETTVDGSGEAPAEDGDAAPEAESVKPAKKAPARKAAAKKA